MAKLKAVNDDLIRQFIESGKYEISPDGMIKNNKGKQIGFTKNTELKLRNKQYKYVGYNGFNLKVHRIIYAKFGKKKLDKDLVVHHKDGNSLNNHIDNLELVSQQANCFYRWVG